MHAYRNICLCIYFHLFSNIDCRVVVTSNSGREFHIGLLYGSPNYRFESFAAISTQTHAANINITNLYLGTTKHSSIPAGTTRQFVFDVQLLNNAIGLTNKSIIISSNADIMVEVYQMHPLSSDGFLAIPTNSMGPHYVIATYTPAVASEFLVIANVDQTRVTISFPDDTRYQGQIYSRNRLLTINIPRHYAFFFRINQDLTGTIIQANHDVAVIAGNPCTNIPTGVQFCDFLIEQFIPTRLLDRNYILGHFADRKSGDIYRIVAANPNETSVWIQNSTEQFVLSQGSFLEFEIHSHNITFVSCNQSCLVVHFNKGFRADDVLTDPMMVIVAGIDQYRSEYTFSTLATSSNYNIDRLFLNIVIQSNFKHQLLLDGALLNNVQWKEIPANITTLNYTTVIYAFAAIKISPGHHVLHHINKNAVFGAVQYGFGQATAYGLLVGIKLNYTAKCKYTYSIKYGFLLILFRS